MSKVAWIVTVKFQV